MFFSRKPYKIILTTMDGLTYTEGDLKVWLESQIIGSRDVCLYPNSAYSWRASKPFYTKVKFFPFSSEIIWNHEGQLPLDDKEKSRILSNIVEHLESKGRKVQIDLSTIDELSPDWQDNLKYIGTIKGFKSRVDIDDDDSNEA